ncbi:TPA: hypothetical protein G8O64_001863 [Salmonella enterica]|uniref:Sugar O-methyltransferase n=1 Tax=Salmonella enterica TaxID=28901 RepID=A0A759GY08_SALER|nr:hypothetical protein [Salmonella enterica]HAG5356289.1 hypothetical protein [Salmonella enterica]
MNNYMIDDTYFEKRYKIMLKHYLAKLIWFALYRTNDQLSKSTVKLFNEILAKISAENNSNMTCASLQQWSKIANEIMANIKHEGINNFLQWKCITETMGEENSSFLYKEYDYLRTNKIWRKIKGKISYPKVGNPLPFLGNIKIHGATVHHSYCLVKFLDKTKISLDSFDNIFEFGGGYGNICKIIHEIGFKGSYHIFDFEIMNMIQKYFLNSHLINKVSFYHEPARWKSALNKIPPDKKNLLIATWSISESPLTARTTTHENMHSFNYFLIGFQEKFGEVNNVNYFNNIKNHHSNIRWIDENMPLLPKHHLLIGF